MDTDINFNSESKVTLMGNNTKRMLMQLNKKNPDHLTISEKIAELGKLFYENIISKNKVVFIVSIIIILFLTHRYYKKKNKEKEGYTDVSLDKDIKNQVKQLKYNVQPSFNRLQSVKDQQTHVNYPPKPLPINIPDKGIIYERNLYADNVPQQLPFEYLNSVDYDYSNVYKYPSRSYHTGTYNPYAYAQDTTIENPLGYPTNFNTSTGDFINQATALNQQNIIDYQTILDNMEGNLIESLKQGPHAVNMNYPINIMEPPYV